MAELNIALFTRIQLVDMNLTDILFLSLALIRIVIGTHLIKWGLRTNHKALPSLGLNFIFNGISYVLHLSFIPYLFFGVIFSFLSIFPYLMFIDKAFYRNKKSIFKGMLIINAILLSIALFFLMKFTKGSNPIPIFVKLYYLLFGICLIIDTSWMILSAKIAFDLIKNNNVIESWIKTKYKLIIYDSVILFLIGLKLVFIDSTINSGELDSIITLFSVFFSIFLEYLAWMMPDWYKHRINRGFNPLEKEFALSSDQDLIDKSDSIIAEIKNIPDFEKQLYQNMPMILSKILSKTTNLSLALSMGIIRLSIKETFPEKAIQNLGFNDILQFLNSSLKNRLERLNFIESDEIINDIIAELIDYQSLLTMDAF